MTAMPISNADPRRMYSWWWDSHISPKNSKWLHENLTDMDSKVKQMIKLIEEDADSFARRAEMYYKKRPELMKMVEDFYRAYRALAARYDHATGVLRQAHRTMSEAFPNQVPLLGDDSPAGSATDSGPCTPELPSMRAFLDPDELHKDAVGLSSSHFRTVKRIGAFAEDSDLVTSRKGLKELNDLLGSGGAGKVSKFTEGRARKGLNFFDSGEKERSTQNNVTLSESDQVSKTETEILALKNALAKLEAEKEAGLLQYQQSLDRLSKLESEVSRAQEDLRGLSQRASTAESEAQNLKELLAKSEAEREVSLLQYEQCLEKISNLENAVLHAQKDAGELDERAGKAETEAESLKQDLAVAEAEKGAALVQYKQCLQATINLEEKLRRAEEDAIGMNERAEKAESEVETLKQALAKLNKEKETIALQYQQCLELIAGLEHKLARAQEENQRLNCELDNGVAKLKGAEEKCILLERSNQTLHSELESVAQTMGTQSQELTEKQKELGRLWACIHEERLQFMEAETAFQTLHQLHSQSQEELRNLAAELQQRAQALKDMEILSQGLQDEIKKVKEENEGLSQLNAYSALSITTLEGEILVLRETARKLEAEVELQVNQRNALQQEIYCMREELNHLNQNHQAVLQQVDSVGSSVKKLQDENSELKEICVRDSNEKTILREKLERMEKLLEKNAILENSILELNVELEGVRGKVRASEESYQCLLGEKSSLVAEKTTLISQLQITIQNMEKVSEEKKMLESSLLDAKAELELLRVKSKSLEDSCLLLSDEKSCLIVEREHLVSQLDTTQQRLEDLEKSHAELNEKYLDLEKERVTILSRLEELRISLNAERQEHASFVQSSETRIHLLQEEGWRWKKEFGELLDSTVGAQIEIFILQKCVQGLEENNFSLLNECEKLLEASKSSKKQISKLEHENQEQQLEVMSLVGQIQILRMGLFQVSKTLDLDIDVDLECEDKNGRDIAFLNNALSKTCDENQQLMLEKSVLLTLLGQLRLEAESVASDRDFLNQELSIKSEKLLLLQAETQKLSNTNEDLRIQVVDGQLKKEELIVELESLLEKQCSSDEAHRNLQGEYLSLAKEISMLKERKCDLEEENLAIIEETISQNTLSLILKNIVSEKSLELKELSKTLEGLEVANIGLKENVRKKERELEAVQTENLSLKESLERSEVDLRLATSVSDQKESELQEAERKLNIMLNEKTEMFSIVEDLKMVKENQEKKILELSEENSLQTKKIEFISEANQTLEAKLCATHLEHEETKIREKSLGDEVELWGMESAAFFSEQQTCTVREVLFEQKIHELAEACEIFEDRSKAKDMEIEALKEKVCTLEDKNEALNDQLATYIPAVTSLASCVTSLESHTIFHGELQKSDARDTKDMHKNGDPIYIVHDGISNLKDLEARIKGIDKAVVETERLATLEHLDTITNLEAAMRQIEELKSRRSSKRENVKTRKNASAKPENEPEEGHRRLQNPSPEISEAGKEVLPKDIMLDQISESSSYGISRRENVGADQMLELWEIESNISTPHFEYLESRKGHKTLNPSIDSLVEKELGVDKLEVSKNISTEANKRKVLERLDSDTQKLTNLQITVQDLKSKVETTENSKKGKIIEYDSVKEQLQETEEAIVKLFELNSMLTKYIHDGSFSSERRIKSGAQPDESGSARRRRIVEQARRGSERLGRLQLEVQKIQFLLLKLDDKKEKKAKTRIREPNPNVMLRDYLYGAGRTRTDQTKKKGHFCACVRPPTRGD